MIRQLLEYFHRGFEIVRIHLYSLEGFVYLCKHVPGMCKCPQKPVKVTGSRKSPEMGAKRDLNSGCLEEYLVRAFSHRTISLDLYIDIFNSDHHLMCLMNYISYTLCPGAQEVFHSVLTFYPS